MRLVLINREKLQALGNALVSEFDNLIARIRAGWNVEHNEDGTHKSIKGETIETGRVVYSGIVQTKLDVPVTHNYDPAGLTTASILRVEPMVNGATISGLRVPQDENGAILDGRVLILENFTENGRCLKLAHEYTPDGQGSLARNRFRIPWQPLATNAVVEFVLHPSTFVTLIYNAKKSRWLVHSQRYDNTSAFLAITVSQNDFKFGTSPRAMRTWRVIPEAPDLSISGFDQDNLPEDEHKTLVNDGRYAIALLHANTASLVQNRIYCPGGVRYMLHPRESVEMQLMRGGGWRLLAKAGQWIDMRYADSWFPNWSVPESGFQCKYRIDGNVMTMDFLFHSATISSNPQFIYCLIPDGRVLARDGRAALAQAGDGAGSCPNAYVRLVAGETRLIFARNTWTDSWYSLTGAAFVSGQITFMIKDAAASMVEKHTDVGHTDAIHADSEHGDVTHVDVTHVDTHGDAPHQDASHSDVAHNDLHTDGSHNDTHTDTAHVDSHGDVAHTDQAHVDSNHLDSHNDVAHTDVAHDDIAHDDQFIDQHGDTGHDDWHGDWHDDWHADRPSHSDGHQDEHYDSHTDQWNPPPVQPPHSDFHTDVHYDSGSQWPHDDQHSDQHDDHHGDAHSDYHNDEAHEDFPHHDTGHKDVTHQDSHQDVPSSYVPHGDGAHTDAHSDTTHTDSHGDVAHGDAHTDIGHVDGSHSDAAHGDAHTDVPHLDIAHTDAGHADTAHGDTAHQDQGLHVDDAHTDI